MTPRPPFRLLALGLLLVLITFALKGPIACSFGPPHVDPREMYARQGSVSFDHSVWNRVLGRIVNEQGLVNYQLLKSDTTELDGYILSLAKAPFDDLGRDDKLALLINAYNAFTIRLILDHYPLESIKDIPSGRRWQGREWQIGRHSWTLNQIEHDECRAKFKEPRVHFALNCASIGCPPMSATAYDGKRIATQLEEQTALVLNDKRWCSVDQDAREVNLTALMKWYKDDFLAGSPTLVDFLSRYRDDVGADDHLEVRYADYDWRLNEWR